jgi:phage tail sheath protein FI
MPESIVPGVWIEEVPTGSAPIDGVDLSTLAVVGAAATGATNVATSVTSVAEFTEHFGAASSTFPMSLALLQFFGNGGRRAVVVRVDRERPRPEDLAGDAAAGTGLHAMPQEDQPGLIAAPDAAFMAEGEAAGVADAVLRHCEARGAFYLLDVPHEVSRTAENATAWASRNAAIRRADAAVYYPWILIPDPSGSAAISVPPSGAMAGLLARSDAEHGLWRAVSGDAFALRGTGGLASELSDIDMNRLQAASINALRRAAGNGIVAWGARTFIGSADGPEYRYIPVRRTAAFIERSISEGLGWAVFEPAGEPLWAQIRLAVSSFMHSMLRAGALQGTHPQDAYFVRCGRDTMTDADLAAGRLVALVGFAPLKPAEFMVIRICIGAASKK